MKKGNSEKTYRSCFVHVFCKTLIIVILYKNISIGNVQCFIPTTIKVNKACAGPCFFLFSSRQGQRDEDFGNQLGDIDGEGRDTIRVRIWKALVSSSCNGEELSIRQLGSLVGERRLGDLKSHLVHVEKQAKTVGNKSKEWKQRRGLEEATTKAKIVKRMVKGVQFIKLVY